jgi:hypothetical protein
MAETLPEDNGVLMPHVQAEKRTVLDKYLSDVSATKVQVGSVVTYLPYA